jgi:outer membrane protein insertion porin family
VIQVRREPVKEDRVNLTFVIDEGKRYTVSDVALEGNKIYTLQELTPALKTRRGYPYSATFISDDEKNVADYYGLRGYADAKVEGSVIPSGPDQVKIVYRITEGELIHVAHINISGNTRTKDYVIRREVAVAPGDEFNTVRVDATRNRLKQMGYFSQVDIRSNATGTPGYKDLDINVTEQSTGTLQLGAGFSSIDSLTGFLNYTETNFDVLGWHNSMKGAGQRFFFGIQYGIERKDAEISLTEPFFLGHRLSAGIDIFFHDLNYLSDEYDERQWGVSFPFRKPIGEHSYAEVRYTIQDMEVDDISATASPQIQAEKGTFLESKLELSLAQDTRDNLFLTRHGHKIEVGGGMVGDWLGGDVDVYTLHAAGQQYFNLPGDLILDLEGAAYSVHSWGTSTDPIAIPIFERLFLGGANNLRGFKYRDVGPKDSTGEPLGGDKSAYGTVELNFPIFGTHDEPKLRGAVFYDIGEVTGGPTPSFGGGVNSDFGFGLRVYLIPGVPIRVDVGFPMQHDQFNDHTAEFNFNLGYKF